MVINFISYPFVFTDTGRRIEIDKINGTPRVGATLDEELNVKGNAEEACSV